MKTLERRIIDRLWAGDLGVSSKTILQAAFDLEVHDGFRPDVPFDFFDMRRCVKLINTIPEAMAGLKKLAETNLGWAAIYADWSRLSVWSSTGEQEDVNNWLMEMRIMVFNKTGELP